MQFFKLKIRYLFLIYIFLSLFGSRITYSQNLPKSGQNYSDEKTENKIEIQSKLSEKDGQIKKLLRQRKDIILAGISLLTVFLLVFILIGLRLKGINDKLREKNNEVETQREEIEKQKEHITQKTIDLLILNKELKENNELREGLTGMIVHDLKNPISNIINLSENREITFFAKNMLMMVENILDIQKYEGMIMPLNKEAVLLKKIIKEAVLQISLYAQHKNVTISNNVHDDLLIMADENIILRVFVNLLTNAIKYTFNNGSVTIESEIEKNDPDKVKISVVDNGIGIKKDKIPLIFNKFSQIIVKDTGEARSTGIGLTFCKMAVEAHESDIEVRSTPNEFTSFSFLLPYIMKNDDLKKTAENYINTEKIVLSFEEKQYLQKFYDELKVLEVYEISELRKIIGIIDEVSENVSEWKKEFSNAIYNCNVELYDQLLKQVL